MNVQFQITDETPLRDICKKYVDQNPRITSEQTGRRYRTTINNFIKWLERDARFSDLTDANYAGWLKSRRDSGRISGGTIRGEAEKLLVIWRWSAKRLGKPAPNIALPPSVDSEPIAWREEELARLEKAARKCRWWIGAIPASLFWPAMIGVAVDTGERLGAIHALRPEDINIDDRIICFRRETRKGKRRDSRKPISKQTLKDVKALIACNPVGPFAPVKQASLYQPMRRLLAEAGLQADRNSMFHGFRRYYATQVALQGGDVTLALGHSDPRLARDSYVDASQMPQFLPKRTAPGFFSGLKRRLGFTG